MRKPFVLLFCLLTVACSKNTNNPSGSNPNAMQYNVSGVTDITLNAYDSATRVIGVGYTSGDQEKITLSLSGVPANVNITFDPASGIPSFAGTMKVNTLQAAGGTYPVKIIATTASNTSKTFEFNLKINSVPVKCNTEVAGSYTGNYTASKRGTYTESMSVTADQFNESLVTIVPVWNYPYFINATVNCTNKTLSIAKQSPSGAPYISLEGSGSYSTDSVVLDYVLTDPSVSGGSENVHLVLKK